MFVITGITGKVGGDVARSLLSKGQKVRAVVRDRAKGDKWAALGCEVSLAGINDAAALTEAFREAEGVFPHDAAQLRSGTWLSRYQAECRGHPSRYRTSSSR